MTLQEQYFPLISSAYSIPVTVPRKPEKSLTAELLLQPFGLTERETNLKNLFCQLSNLIFQFPRVLFNVNKV